VGRKPRERLTIVLGRTPVDQAISRLLRRLPRGSRGTVIKQMLYVHLTACLARPPQEGK